MTREQVSTSEHFWPYTHAVDWTGPEIRRRRESRGLTQQQLADAIGGSRRSVIAWERGEAAPQGRFFGQLDRILGGPTDPAGDGPLLREATFAETVSHLMTLYSRAVRDAGAEAQSHEDELPDPAHHRVAEGPRDEPNRRRPTRNML